MFLAIFASIVGLGIAPVHAGVSAIVAEIQQQLALQDGTPVALSAQSCGSLEGLGAAQAEYNRLNWCIERLGMQSGLTRIVRVHERNLQQALHLILAAIPRRGSLAGGFGVFWGTVGAGAVGSAVLSDTQSSSTRRAVMGSSVAVGALGAGYQLWGRYQPAHGRPAEVFNEVRRCFSAGDPAYFQNSMRPGYPRGFIPNEMQQLAFADREAGAMIAGLENGTQLAVDLGCRHYLADHPVQVMVVEIVPQRTEVSSANRTAGAIPDLAVGRSLSATVRETPNSTAPSSAEVAASVAVGAAIRGVVRTVPGVGAAAAVFAQ